MLNLILQCKSSKFYKQPKQQWIHHNLEIEEIPDLGQLDDGSRMYGHFLKISKNRQKRNSDSGMLAAIPCLLPLDLLPRGKKSVLTHVTM